MVRVTKNGKGDPCREKAFRYIQQVNEKFPVGVDDTSRFKALLDVYNRAAACEERTGENFIGNNVLRFADDHATALKLAFAHRESVIVMRESCKEMAKLPPAGVNGTSVEFAKCQALCKVVEKNLKLAARNLEENLLSPKRPVNENPVIKLTVKAMEAVPAIVLLADVMAA